ncbi:MAG: D-alanyl-D-alanine carboxypeptidase family protein [Bacillota bacterium]|nr:D-alanyl-D-alanine carboxypeptidase family protein [Bacillota bacterium]
MLGRTKINVFTAALIVFMSFGEVPSKAAPDSEIKAPYVSAHYAVAVDAGSKRILYDKNAHSITPMASTTKIMTALVALKYGELDKKVPISARAAGIRGSVVGYRKGEEITIRELVYGLMLRSGNDAAIAIAEGITGSVDKFAHLMNEYAATIGLVDTHFESPHGLDSVMHYTTAYDLALLTAKAKETREFNEIVAAKIVTKEQYGFSRGFNNINKILWFLPQANGVKTGYTGKAGKCLVSSVNKDGNDIIIVLINCPQRWQETKKIYEYITRRYEYKKVSTKNEPVYSMKVPKAKSELKLVCREDAVVPVRIGAEIETKVAVPKDLTPPLSRGEKVGTMNIYEDKKLIYSTPLISSNTLEKQKGLRKWFKFLK